MLQKENSLLNSFIKHDEKLTKAIMKAKIYIDEFASIIEKKNASTPKTTADKF